MIAPLEPGGGNGVVFFAGGGTGGHLFPALAVAEVLARDHGHEPCFLTGPRPLEREILGRSPFPRHEISIAGRGRSGLLGEWRRAGELFRRLRPRGVIGLGGARSVAVGLQAVRRRLPLFLLEQNRVLGRANRILLPWARRMFLSLPGTRGGIGLGRRALRLGCPVRSSFRRRAFPPGPPELLVLGGSQGAEQLNDLVLRILPRLGELASGLVITHVTGPGRRERWEGIYRENGVRAQIAEFLEDPAEAMGRAWLVLARAGGGTLAELAAVGRGALLLPYPHHRDRQQFRNAEAFVEGGAGEIISDDSDRVARRLVELFEDRTKLEGWAANACRLGPERAAGRIAEVIATHLESGPDGATAPVGG